MSIFIALAIGLVCGTMIGWVLTKHSTPKLIRHVRICDHCLADSLKPNEAKTVWYCSNIKCSNYAVPVGRR